MWYKKLDYICILYDVLWKSIEFFWEYTIIHSMNDTVDYQLLYNQLHNEEKRVYLDLVEKTRSAVFDAIKKSLSYENIREWVVELRLNISSLVSELMRYIAENDIVWFSFNPGTDLRHSILWLGAWLSGCGIMFEQRKMMVADANNLLSFEHASDADITTEVRVVLEKRLRYCLQFKFVSLIGQYIRVI